MLEALAKYMPETTASWTKPEERHVRLVTLPEGMDGAALLYASIDSEKSRVRSGPRLLR